MRASNSFYTYGIFDVCIGDNFVRFHRDFLALSPDNFAKLFRPTSSMLNKVCDHWSITDVLLISDMGTNYR